MEAISNFPEKAEKLYTKEGVAILLKTDIFKGLMFYGYEKEGGRGRMYPLHLEQVREVKEMNKRSEKPTNLMELQVMPEYEEEEIGFADDVTGVVELPMEERRRREKEAARREQKKNQYCRRAEKRTFSKRKTGPKKKATGQSPGPKKHQQKTCKKGKP